MRWQALADGAPELAAFGAERLNAGSAFPRDARFLLYELGVGSAFSTTYGTDGQPQRQRWHAPDR